MKRLKDEATLIAGQSPPSSNVAPLEAGLPFIQGNAEFGKLSPRPKLQSDSAPKRAQPGDILISVRAPVGALNIADQDLAIGRGVCAIRAGSHTRRYLWWFLHHAKEELNAASTGSTFAAITSATLGSLQIPEVSTTARVSIANYLDRETAQIDTLIAKQEQLIATLRERRIALIAQKTAGDAAWTTSTVKRFGQVTLGKMLQSTGRAGDVKRKYLRAANVQPDGALQLDDVKSMWFTPSEIHTLDLLQNDVVVVEGGIGGFGRAAYLSRPLPDTGFQNSINRVRPRAKNDGRFLTYALLAARSAGFIAAYCNVVSMPHLTAEKLAAMPLRFPGFDTQRQVADHLDVETAKIDTLITKAERFIALSKERRAALITAAVTGQIEVPGT